MGWGAKDELRARAKHAPGILWKFSRPYLRSQPFTYA
jgi:hypothetical protein